MRWSLVLLLAGAVFINYVDRGAMPTAAHLLQDELSLSARELGVLFGAFFWSYALLQIPAGYLAERFGALPVLACGLVVWAAATMLVGAAHSFATLLGLRLLLGIGESVSFPCVSKLLAAEVPVGKSRPGQRGHRLRLSVRAGRGGVSGRQPARQLRLAGDVLDIRRAFAAVADSVGERQSPLPGCHPWPAGSPALRSLLRQRSLWGTSLAHFSANYTYYFMLTWLPLYLVKERGLSD